MAKEVSTRMWKIGRILVEAREKVNPKFKGAFYQGVANHMKEDMALSTLYSCAKLYERFPDFLARYKKTGLIQPNDNNIYISGTNTKFYINVQVFMNDTLIL